MRSLRQVNEKFESNPDDPLREVAAAIDRLTLELRRQHWIDTAIRHGTDLARDYCGPRARAGI
jgi:hypothetical protein